MASETDIIFPSNKELEEDIQRDDDEEMKHGSMF